MDREASAGELEWRPLLVIFRAEHYAGKRQIWQACWVYLRVFEREPRNDRARKRGARIEYEIRRFLLLDLTQESGRNHFDRSANSCRCTLVRW